MTDNQKTEQLLRDLAASLVEHPEALRVAHQIAEDGSIYWAMKGHDDDEPKLVGQRGSHVDAITLLVSQIGKANGKPYTFRLITINAPIDRPKAPPRDVIDYDPAPAKNLLVRILESLEIGAFAVSVGPGPGARNSLTFVFTIGVNDISDFMTLTYRPDPKADETIEGALGTLYRAIAKKDGVRFFIKVEEPL